jgi:ParB family chromosome partitioning protein
MAPPKQKSSLAKNISPPKTALERSVVDISTLNPSEYNPRTISKEAAEGLAHSIKSFGLVQEIVVNRRGGRNRIVGGHQRVEVMKQMGETKAAVVFVDLDDKAERALNVVLNNEHIAGEWNNDALVSLLDQIKSDGAVNFDTLQLTELLNTLCLPPEDFKKLDESIDVNMICPKCKYQWNASKT